MDTTYRLHRQQRLRQLSRKDTILESHVLTSHSYPLPRTEEPDAPERLHPPSVRYVSTRISKLYSSSESSNVHIIRAKFVFGFKLVVSAYSASTKSREKPGIKTCLRYNRWRDCNRKRFMKMSYLEGGYVEH
jgi:hypothetical protein